MKEKKKRKHSTQENVVGRRETKTLEDTVVPSTLIFFFCEVVKLEHILLLSCYLKKGIGRRRTAIHHLLDLLLTPRIMLLFVQQVLLTVALRLGHRQ